MRFVCLWSARQFWGLGLSFSVLKLFNSQSEGFSQGLFNNLKRSKVELSLYSLKRDANFDSKSTRAAITLANFFYSRSFKNPTLWCFSSSVKKCAKDGKWLVNYPSITLWKQKTKKHQGGEGNGLNPAAIFTGGSGNSGVVVHGRFRGEWVKEIWASSSVWAVKLTLKDYILILLFLTFWSWTFFFLALAVVMAVHCTWKKYYICVFWSLSLNLSVYVTGKLFFSSIILKSW